MVSGASGREQERWWNGGLLGWRIVRCKAKSFRKDLPIRRWREKEMAQPQVTGQTGVMQGKQIPA